MRLTPDTLVLQVGASAVVAVPRSLDQRIYVRTGASRVRSALTNAYLAGATAAFLATRTDASRASVVRATVGMTLAGLLLGVFRPMPRWKRVAP